MNGAIRVGDALPERAAPDINVERIKAVMTVMGDVNPVHIDEELVKRLGLRGLVNQGPCNLSYICNMLTAWTGDPDCVRRFQIRFHNMVVPGDNLVAGGRVKAVNGDGTVECDVWLRLADGTTMLSGAATVAVTGAQ